MTHQPRPETARHKPVPCPPGAECFITYEHCDECGQPPDAETHQVAAAPEAVTVGEFVASHAALLPAEKIAVTIAQAQIERGENPQINVTTALLLAVERLSAEVDRLCAHCNGREAALHILSDQFVEAQRERDALAAEVDHARHEFERERATGGCTRCASSEKRRVHLTSRKIRALSAGGTGRTGE